MKNTDIQKIRQLAEEVFSVADADNEPEETHGFARVKRLATKILALLPCETCGGTGGVWWDKTDKEIISIVDACQMPDGAAEFILCPDCQPESSDNRGNCPVE